MTGHLSHHFFQTDNVSQVSEAKSRSTVFPALILVYTVIVTDQRKRNILPSRLVNLGFVNLGFVNLGFVNLGFGWGVRRGYLSDL